MSRERYLLERDTMADKLGLKDTYKKAQKSMSGINLSRGIGRGLGLLGALALAPTGASVPLLAMYGGLGSLGGSFLGGAIGKHKYGGPAKASQDQLFHRDVAEEQREGVDQYWKGLKEQTAVNALQDAVTAGMYGSQIKTGMNELKFKLGGGYKGMAPTGAPPIQQVDPSGLVPDYQQQQVGQYLDQIKQSNIARADSFGKSVGTTTSGSFAGDAGAGVGGGLAGGGGGGGAGQGMNNWIENFSFPDWAKMNLTSLQKNTMDITGNTDPKSVISGVTTMSGPAQGSGFGAATTYDVPTDITSTGINTEIVGNESDWMSRLKDYSGGYTKDALSNYGTGPNFLQDAVTNTGYTGSAAQNRQLIDYYNQTGPVQYNSVVDMLKAQGQGSSFDARTNLWNQLSQMGVR